MKACTKQPNDQSGLVPASDSALPCSDNEQLPAASELQDQETASASLIENWIDA